MKKIVFILAAIGIPMMLWSQKPTLTTEVKALYDRISVYHNNIIIYGSEVRYDTVFITNYQLETGETYTIKVKNPQGELESGDSYIYSYFTEWLLDGVSYSTSPEIQLTMDTLSHIHLTAVMARTTKAPYSPVANWFEPTTGVLTLDEIRTDISDAITMSHNRYKFARDDVFSIVVKGDLSVNAAYSSVAFSDFYNVYFDDEASYKPWNNLQTIDLSQTAMTVLSSNYNKISSLPALEHIVLGPSTKEIGTLAFYGLNIKTIDCYAATPPACTAGELLNTFDNMNVPKDEVLIRVPPQSVELYKQADGWKDFPNIQPLTEVANITVTLPTDVPEGYYDDMTVELRNLRSELGQSRMVYNKREFIFYGQLQDFEYQAVLKNAYGQVMGESDAQLLGEDDITLTFGNLLRKKDVSLKVTTPDGTDVTSKVRVLWTDESGKMLGYTSTLKAVAEGTKLSCKVTPTSELALQYVSPDAMPVTVNGEGENLLTVVLQPLLEITLHGQVKDQQTGEGIADAMVALTQQQAGNLSEFVTATTDEDGRFELQGTNGAGELSVTAMNYLPATMEFAAPEADGALPSVELTPFNGIIVSKWLTYTEAAKEGEEGNVTDNYNDENGDIIYQIYNLNKNSSVTDFILQGKLLYFPSGVETGNYLLITASSRTNSFSDVTEACQIGNDGLGYVTLSIKQLGGMEANVNTDENQQVMGILYDANGKFVRSNRYTFGTLSFSNLPSGYYTLVSMSYNYLMSRILRLSTLDDMGLVDGTDYVKNTVLVQDGRIATVSVSDVPSLDEGKLRFTDEGTYIIADKNIISAGQTVALRSKIIFAEQYAGRTGDVELVLDLPEGVDLVEYSAMNGTTYCDYRKEDDGRYIFSSNSSALGLSDDLFRLSVKTTQPGAFNISGSVRFTLDGVQMTQPFGTVWIQSNGVVINEPGFEPPSTLRVSGTAPVGCETVEIYDNDRMVGHATVSPNGIWTAGIQIPNTVARHEVKARMATLENGEAVGESETRFYDRTTIVAERVIMVPPHSQDPVTFDYFENAVSPTSYKYIIPKYWTTRWQGAWMKDISYTTDFTFLAFFNDPDLPKTDDEVKIQVRASDGTKRTLKAKYDESLQCYHASTNYPNSSKIPVSAYAYTYKPLNKEYEPLGETIKKVMTEMDKVAIKAAEKGEVELLPDDEETLRMTYTVSGKIPLALAMKEITYDEAAERAMDGLPFIYRNEEDTIVCTFVNGTDEAELLLLDVKRRVALQTTVTYAETNGLNAMPDKSLVAPRKGKPSPIDALKLIEKGTNMGSTALTIFGLKGYATLVPNIIDMDQFLDSVYRAMKQEEDAISDILLYSQCYVSEDYNSGVISYWKRTFDTERYHYYSDQTSIIFNNYLTIFDKKMETANNMVIAAGQKIAYDLLWAGVTKAVSKGVTAGYKSAQKIITGLDETILEANKFMKAFDGAYINTMVLGTEEIFSLVDKIVGYDFDYIYKDYEVDLRRAGISTIKAMKNLKKEIKEEEVRLCPNDDEAVRPDDFDFMDDDEDGSSGGNGKNGKNGRSPFPEPVKPLIDPQGYVYEAVPSNRVEDATAVIYYKSGDTDVMWDAENYGQVNPQITKSDGMYQWDVPQGQWQVRVQKEGYENTASEWLPVPPPQLDVNIPIVRSRLPKVEKAYAYKDAVAVKFDTYMQPSLLTTEQITVKENGSDVAGTIELTDEEEAQAGVSYASRLRFVPATPFTATEVTLTVSGQVANYAGIEMDEPYEAVLPIEGEVKSLEAEHELKIDYQATGVIHLKGIPAAAAAGKKVTVKCQSGIIASVAQTEVVLDANGEADVTVQGSLPGSEIVTFTMADPGLSTGTLVKVIRKTAFVVEAPEASVATETMVEKGTGITLTCSTEDAAIYFTLDGSSPVDSDTRILYDGTPIVINAETTLAAVAVVEGKGVSEVRVWHYTVPLATRIEDMNSADMKVTPVRVRDSFVVTGMDGMFSVSVYSMTGKQLMLLSQVTSGQIVKVAALQTGVYLVVVSGEDAYFTQRIIKE